ncbi:unnamed protein product [Ectocarpus sp. 12 AP-2014]
MSSPSRHCSRRAHMHREQIRPGSFLWQNISNKSSLGKSDKAHNHKRAKDVARPPHATGLVCSFYFATRSREAHCLDHSSFFTYQWVRSNSTHPWTAYPYLTRTCR